MNKEFESLRNSVNARQNKIQREGTERQNKTQLELKKRDELVQKRIDFNEKLLESCGVKPLFEQIISENILNSETQIGDGLDNLKKDVGILFRTSYPESDFNKSIDKIYSSIDGSSYISLTWDYEFINGGADNDSYKEKRVSVFVKNGKVFVNYSSRNKDLKPNPVNNNLTKLITNALINAESTR